jgi:hypothetical protein
LLDAGQKRVALKKLVARVLVLVVDFLAASGPRTTTTTRTSGT